MRDKLIAVLGIMSFYTLFAGTAASILIFGFEIGFRVLVSSGIILFFALVLENTFGNDG
jgi:uncharacterized membrane protein